MLLQSDSIFPYSITVTLFILCFLGVTTSRRPTQNITIEVPYGTSNHGKSNLLCTPATWIDIAKFLLFNYVAHGATVVSYPGEPPFDIFLCVVTAIFFPTFGIMRALNFIARHPVLIAKDDLQKAARSGALCMLIRSPSWRPQRGDNLRNALIKDPGSEPSLRGRNTTTQILTHGTSPTAYALSTYTPPWLRHTSWFWLYTDTGFVEVGSRLVFGLGEPVGDQYKYAFVPPNATVVGLAEPPTPTPSSNVPDIPLLRSVYRIFASPDSTPRLSSSFNLVKGVAALLQSLYASFTLYLAIGGEVDQYGFAAPGFTVLPYAVMSALNLMANIVTPHYPTLYLVRSEVMEEAERRGLAFDYPVGRVVDETRTNDIIMEGWSEVAGSFKDADKLLYVTSAAEEDEKIEISDSSGRTIYIPTCPMFRRTDDTQASPFREFIESPPRRLEFPLYQYQHGPLLLSISQLSSRLYRQLPQPIIAFTFNMVYRPLSQLRIPDCMQRSRQSLSAYFRRTSRIMNMPGVFIAAIIINVELFVVLGLSNYSGQQSTVAQRVWTLTWFLGGYMLGGPISGMRMTISDTGSKFWTMALCLMFGVFPIGGFIAVSQMLKKYGTCYRFV